jgi:phosphate/sulfate permease
VPYLLLELIIIKANPGVILRRRLAIQNVVFVFVSVCVCGLLLAFAFIFFFSRLGISWERKKKEKKREKGREWHTKILFDFDTNQQRLPREG